LKKRFGKVFLVGAGPGDPELMTVKARRVLEEADVILYDSLVGEQIIEMLMEMEAELIDVGKRGGFHRYSQDEINQMIVGYAKEGKTVVRLKGGDPYLFGRGGEEAEVIAEEGIEVEVVPGITSAIAVPASAGIPVTHRDFASSVTFITGHEADEKEKTSINWKALAELGGTLVILMGVKKLADNITRLLGYGMSPETPVAIIEKGTTPFQKVTVGKLKNIVDMAEKNKVRPPAIVVIGRVVTLHEKLFYKK
jgi:uroporphyrin-III C-methyltransferase